MVLSSTPSPRCSGDHLPGDTRSSLSSTHFVSHRLLLGIGVLGNHAVHEVQRGVQRRMRRWRPSSARRGWDPRASSGGTRCPTSTRNRPLARSTEMPREIELACSGERSILHALAQRAGQSRLTAAFCRVSLCSSIRRIPSSRPSDNPDGLQRSCGPTDPSPPEPHRRPSQSPGAHGAGQRHDGHQNHAIIVLEQGFEGARLNTGTMSDLPTLAATLLANFATVRIPRCESLWIRPCGPTPPRPGTGCCHVRSPRETLIMNCHRQHLQHRLLEPGHRAFFDRIEGGGPDGWRLHFFCLDPAAVSALHDVGVGACDPGKAVTFDPEQFVMHRLPNWSVLGVSTRQTDGGTGTREA